MPTILNLVALRALSLNPSVEEGSQNTFVLSRDVVGKIYAFISHYKGKGEGRKCL